MRMRIAVVVIVLGALLGQVYATDYFVGKGGDDGNDGLSRTSAFLTIQKGVDTLADGDTLTIGPGEYFENVRRDKLGDAEKETVIRAEIPGTVFLRGDVPAPEFRKLPGRRFVYVADFDFAGEVPAVNELDTLRIFERVPNAAEPDFLPGTFYYDRTAGKLYISPSDMRSASVHRYSISVIPTHGFYLTAPRRVVIEGLGVTGFNALEELNHREGTFGGVWGMFLVHGKDCVIRDCRAWLNGWGIGLNSADSGSGDNVIERCMAWANNSQFCYGDMGGLTLFSARRDVIRDSTAFLNGMYGINIYGTGTDGGTYGDKNVPGNDDKNKSRLLNNFAWGNKCDFKIKTGVEYFHIAEQCVGLGLWSITPGNVLNCIIGITRREYLGDNIVLPEEKQLDMQREFADPDNYDYRLQATSRFRNAAPDGNDRGPFPYKENIFYVSPNGDDKADGLSVENAWRTLARAAKALRPDDTLYLEAGVYAEVLVLNVQGKDGALISIRGRGREAVVIEGGLQVNDSLQVELKRLNFGGEAKIEKSSNIAFDNCSFTGEGTALETVDSTLLSLSHCVFTGFKDAAVAFKNGSNIDLRGNLFDNHDSVAVRLDSGEGVKYSDYNSYSNAANVWEVTGKKQTFAEVQKMHDQHSQEQVPEFAVKDAPPILKNWELFSAIGPMGKPVGWYCDKPLQQKLRLTHGPEIHSVSATTANVEWMTSLPATCELAWGETPECKNTTTFDVNYFGTYSLSGLKAGQTFYFKIKSLRIPTDMTEQIDAKPVELEGEAISFATLKENAPPATYYVASDGDDGNTGLDRQKAWKTITHAAEKVNVGDTVLISGGVYPERVRIRATGEIGAPITFKCMPGEKVILDGAGKSLNTAFVAARKNYLCFDGLYFRDFGFFPSQGWIQIFAGEFHLYYCKNVRITRCFSDGLGGYTARSITALNVEDLLVRNCVNTNKMSGAMMLVRCPNLRIENCVFARPMIASFVLRNQLNQRATMENNIFTDMLKKKAALNIGLFVSDSRLPCPQMRNNCYMLRCFPPAERALFHTNTVGQLEQYISTPLFADPEFAGVAALSQGRDEPHEFPVELLMDPNLKLDFDSFFATNAEVVKRGIGLQPDAFKDFHFDRTETPRK